MKIKNEHFYWAIFIILVVGLIWFYQTRNQVSKNETENMEETPSMQTETPKIVTPTSTTDSWTGILKNSDNLTKGALMLMTPEHTIYIKTSRDYSKLINSKVTLSFEGSLERFKLKDITPVK